MKKRRSVAFFPTDEGVSAVWFPLSGVNDMHDLGQHLIEYLYRDIVKHKEDQERFRDAVKCCLDTDAPEGYDGLTIAQRYQKYIKDNQWLNDYLEEVRISYTEFNGKIYQTYTQGESHESMVAIEFMQLIINEIHLKPCKYCGKYFLNFSNYEIEYCSRVAPGETKTCRQIGPTKVYKRNLDENELLKMKNREYQRRYAKIRHLESQGKEIKLKELRKWVKTADHLIMQEPSVQEFKKWIHDNKGEY